ncbi:MAG: heavy metal translocating P-type ATPase [Burkholderiaceae bacterium]
MPEPFIDLQIEGMTCAGCVARVVKAVERIPGARAEVSLLEHRARIQGADLDTAVAAIRRAGYAASPMATPRPPEPGDDAHQTGGAQERKTSEGGETREASGSQPTGSAETRMTVVAVVALVVMVFEMVAMIIGGHGGHGFVPLAMQALLATIMQLWIGAPIAYAGLRSVAHGRASMETLILLGTGTAYLWSMAVWLGSDAGPVYFEASVVVIAMLHLGQKLQAKAQARTLAALAPFLHEPVVTALRLHDAQSTLATIQHERLSAIPASQLRAGDRVWVGPGSRLACDGRILEGTTEFDEAGLTGESLPAPRGVGDRVVGGAINLLAPVILQVEGNPQDWRHARLREQMRSALASRAPIAAWADRVAAVFVPLVALTAAVNLVGQSLWGPGFAVALERTIALLVIACPCALGLATPMAVATGLARAAQHGWLFRSATSLQKAAALTHLVFDKTGTLTEGRPRLVGIASASMAPRPIQTEDFPDWLALATAAQEGNPHPIAGAFWSQAAGRPTPALANAPEVSLGLGVRALTTQAEVLVGRSTWVASVIAKGPDHVPPEPQGRPWPGASEIDVAVNGHWAGRLWAADTLKADAAEAIAALRTQGLGVRLLSGDRAEAVRPVALALGLDQDEAQASQHPEDKAARLRQWQQQGETVGMVGDGMNDIAAMAQADLAIALSAGASLTLKTADVTLTNSQRLRAVPEMLAFARRVKRRIIENLVFAFGFNVLALPMAALGLLPPALAGAAMALSSLAVVTNALRLLKD